MKSLNSLVLNNAETPTLTDLTPRTFPAACRAKLETLKNNLVRRFTEEFADLQAQLVRQAVDEADALASLTTLPHLFLPTLAEEKLQYARVWNQRQNEIYQRAGLALAA